MSKSTYTPKGRWSVMSEIDHDIMRAEDEGMIHRDLPVDPFRPQPAAEIIESAEDMVCEW